MHSHTPGPTAQQLKETSFRFDFRVTGHSTPTTTTALDPPATHVDNHTDTVGPDISTSMRVQVSGPEPGYVATPMIFIALARCLLEEYDIDTNVNANSSAKQMKTRSQREGVGEGVGAGGKQGGRGGVLPRGGVLTPQAVFSNSLKIFDFLNEAEIVFKVVE